MEQDENASTHLHLHLHLPACTPAAPIPCSSSSASIPTSTSAFTSPPPLTHPSAILKATPQSTAHFSSTLVGSNSDNSKRSLLSLSQRPPTLVEQPTSTALANNKQSTLTADTASPSSISTPTPPVAFARSALGHLDANSHTAAPPNSTSSSHSSKRSTSAGIRATAPTKASLLSPPSTASCSSSVPRPSAIPSTTSSASSATANASDLITVASFCSSSQPPTSPASASALAGRPPTIDKTSFVSDIARPHAFGTAHTTTPGLAPHSPLPYSEAKPQTPFVSFTEAAQRTQTTGTAPPAHATSRIPLLGEASTSSTSSLTLPPAPTASIAPLDTSITDASTKTPAPTCAESSSSSNSITLPPLRSLPLHLPPTPQQPSSSRCPPASHLTTPGPTRRSLPAGYGFTSAFTTPLPRHYPHAHSRLPVGSTPAGPPSSEPRASPYTTAHPVPYGYAYAYPITYTRPAHPAQTPQPLHHLSTPASATAYAYTASSSRDFETPMGSAKKSGTAAVSSATKPNGDHCSCKDANDNTRAQELHSHDMRQCNRLDGLCHDQAPVPSARYTRANIVQTMLDGKLAHLMRPEPWVHGADYPQSFYEMHPVHPESSEVAAKKLREKCDEMMENYGGKIPPGASSLNPWDYLYTRMEKPDRKHFTDDQRQMLEVMFEFYQTPSPEAKQRMGAWLGTHSKYINTWAMNQRADCAAYTRRLAYEAAMETYRAECAAAKASGSPLPPLPEKPGKKTRQTPDKTVSSTAFMDPRTGKPRSLPSRIIRQKRKYTIDQECVVEAIINGWVTRDAFLEHNDLRREPGTGGESSDEEENYRISDAKAVRKSITEREQPTYYHVPTDMLFDGYLPTSARRRKAKDSIVLDEVMEDRDKEAGNREYRRPDYVEGQKSFNDNAALAAAMPTDPLSSPYDSQGSNELPTETDNEDDVGPSETPVRPGKRPAMVLGQVDMNAAHHYRPEASRATGSPGKKRSALRQSKSTLGLATGQTVRGSIARAKSQQFINEGERSAKRRRMGMQDENTAPLHQHAGPSSRPSYLVNPKTNRVDYRTYDYSPVGPSRYENHVDRRSAREVLADLHSKDTSAHLDRPAPSGRHEPTPLAPAGSVVERILQHGPQAHLDAGYPGLELPPRVSYSNTRSGGDATDDEQGYETPFSNPARPAVQGEPGQNFHHDYYRYPVRTPDSHQSSRSRDSSFHLDTPHNHFYPQTSHADRTGDVFDSHAESSQSQASSSSAPRRINSHSEHKARSHEARPNSASPRPRDNTGHADGSREERRNMGTRPAGDLGAPVRLAGGRDSLSPRVYTKFGSHFRDVSDQSQEAAEALVAIWHGSVPQGRVRA